MVGFKCQVKFLKKLEKDMAEPCDSQDDDDRICILMDALHDRILMEDQKWWAGAAFCSLATLARFPHVRIQIYRYPPENWHIPPLKRHSWVDVVPFPVWWDMLVALRVHVIQVPACMNKTHIPFVTKGLPHCSHGCFLHPKSFRHPHDWLQTSSILMCLYTVYPRLDCIPGPRPKCMRQSHERFFSAGTLQSVFTTNVCIGALLLPMVANDSWLFVN